MPVEDVTTRRHAQAPPLPRRGLSAFTPAPPPPASAHARFRRGGGGVAGMPGEDVTPKPRPSPRVVGVHARTASARICACAAPACGVWAALGRVGSALALALGSEAAGRAPGPRPGHGAPGADAARLLGPAPPRAVPARGAERRAGQSSRPGAAAGWLRLQPPAGVQPRPPGLGPGPWEPCMGSREVPESPPGFLTAPGGPHPHPRVPPSPWWEEIHLLLILNNNANCSRVARRRRRVQGFARFAWRRTSVSHVDPSALNTHVGSPTPALRTSPSTSQIAAVARPLSKAPPQSPLSSLCMPSRVRMLPLQLELCSLLFLS